MTAFLDRPAEGVVLMLRSAPRYLRVVIDAAGKVDALDQPEDTPAEGERVHVYERVGDPTVMFLCFRGRQKAMSGRYVEAEYRHRGDVDGEQLRDRAALVAWAEADYHGRA